MCFWLLDWAGNDLLANIDCEKLKELVYSCKCPKSNDQMIFKVRSPPKIQEIESKNYKYAKSEQELSNLPWNKHEATFCFSQI